MMGDKIVNVFFGLVGILIIAILILGAALLVKEISKSDVQSRETYNLAMEGDKTAAVAWCDIWGSNYTSEWCLNNFGFEIVAKSQ